MYIEGTTICEICLKRVNSLGETNRFDIFCCPDCDKEIMPMIVKLYDYYKKNNVKFTLKQKIRMNHTEKIAYRKYINDKKDKEIELIYSQERRKIKRKLIDKYEKIIF